MLLCCYYEAITVSWVIMLNILTIVLLITVPSSHIANYRLRCMALYGDIRRTYIELPSKLDIYGNV